MYATQGAYSDDSDKEDIGDMPLIDIEDLESYSQSNTEKKEVNSLDLNDNLKLFSKKNYALS